MGDGDSRMDWTGEEGRGERMQALVVGGEETSDTVEEKEEVSSAGWLASAVRTLRINSATYSIGTGG